ncbi:MAG: CapA family protein [Hymenobacteraceae bacterium]|nr:CapA family protein [Hymenobacteraceae bacterium]MDX5397053.1 CapA family protein [Hymenobacteraceae bacterium]MDX5513124.1 CapA family protein [Hymenobacteraceae bacterium]
MENFSTTVLPAVGITLFLCGDVMPGRGIDQILPHSADPVIYEPYVKDARDYVRLAERVNGPVPRNASYANIWGDALKVWQQVSPDLKIINLETSITTHSDPWPGKQIQYRMHPDNVAVLTAAGIDYCSLGNNHTLDWSRPGLLETMQTLRQANIAYSGAGAHLEEARKPAVLKTGKGSVLIFSYGSETAGIPVSWAATPEQSGVNLLPDLSDKTVHVIKQQVKKVMQPGDVVVFSVHWGSNWGYDIPPLQRRFAQQLIDSAGVDVVFGHSSHHPRGIEVYKDKLILYGAGDFINDYEGISGHELYRGDLSLMYFPQIEPATGKLISMKMVPMKIKNFRLNYASAADAKWMQNLLNREGSKLGTNVKLNEDGSLLLQW